MVLNFVDKFYVEKLRSSLLVTEVFWKRYGLAFATSAIYQNNRYLGNTKWWQQPWNILSNLLKCFLWTKSSTNLFTPLSCIVSSIFISFTASEWHSPLIPIPNCCCRWESFVLFFQLPSFLLVFLHGSWFSGFCMGNEICLWGR